MFPTIAVGLDGISFSWVWWPACLEFIHGDLDQQCTVMLLIPWRPKKRFVPNVASEVIIEMISKIRHKTQKHLVMCSCPFCKVSG